VGPLERSDFPPTVDVEFESTEGRPGTGLTIGQALEWVEAAWQVLFEVYGAAPLLYTSERIWVEEFDNAPAPRLIESPLWLAKPWPWAVRTLARRDAAFFADGRHDPRVPRPWGSQWFIHQYQGDALGFPGFSATVDINRFRTTSDGAAGDHVKWMQRRLGIDESGAFDAATREAAVAHQSANGLVADGIVGPKTFASLCWS
jgi:peptidoglycan hydrolase-like protein with peptidoglycan-binding domain